MLVRMCVLVLLRMCVLMSKLTPHRALLILQRLQRDYALDGKQPFQGREPMVIVGVAEVGIAVRLCGGNTAAKLLGPLAP
jgi:hypothetical protein